MICHATGYKRCKLTWVFDFCRMQKSLSSCSFCSILLFNKAFFWKVSGCCWFAWWYILVPTSWSENSCNHLIYIFYIISDWNLWQKRYCVVVGQRPYQYSMTFDPYLPVHWPECKWAAQLLNLMAPPLLIWYLHLQFQWGYVRWRTKPAFLCLQYRFLGLGKTES